MDLMDPLLCDNLPNSLPNEKNSDVTKFKAFTDNKIMFRFVFDSVENIVGKGENAGYQHFLLFLQGFQKAMSSDH